MNERPFRYATFRECLSTGSGDEILAWFEDDAPWRLKSTDFYEQYEFSCWDCASPIASYVTSSMVLDVVRTTMTEVFGRSFEKSISVVAHKLLQGQRIGIHNDYLTGEESHRLVIQLSHGLSDDDGGFLMLFNSDDPADIDRVMRPAHLSGFAFEISPASFTQYPRCTGESDLAPSIHSACSPTRMLSEYMNEESRLWFPGLAGYLVADLASRVQVRRALMDHYGTQRWLTGDTNASIVDMGTVRLGRHLSTIEHLPTSTATSFSNLTFADNKYSHATAQIQAAAEVLDSMNALADTVGCLVRSIHLLQAPTDHDVSHSSPDLPFSVFVSIPEPTERDADLRVTESLIHESMHLQLSLVNTVRTSGRHVGFLWLLALETRGSPR